MGFGRLGRLTLGRLGASGGGGGPTYGPELLSNGPGGFSGTTGWAGTAGGTLSVVSGELVITTNGTNYSDGRAVFTTEIGEEYEYRVTIRRGTGGDAGVVIKAPTNVTPLKYNTTTENVEYITRWTAAATTSYVVAFHPLSPGAGTTIIVNRASVRKVM